jgi:hypothetical protein
MIIAVENEEEAKKLIKIMDENWIEAQIAWKIIETPKWEEPSIKISNIR